MNLDRRLRLRHVETFVTIVRLGSFKAAAEALYLTQPGISRTVRELEAITGSTLLVRSRAGVRPTEAGEALIRRFAPALAGLSEGLASVAGQEATRERVVVGCLPSVAARLLPKACERFHDTLPTATLVLEEGSHEHLSARLRRGELDLLIGRLGSPATMHGITFTQLYEEHVAVVARPGHPAAVARSLADIAPFAAIYPPTGSAIRPLVDRMMIAAGRTIDMQRTETVSGAFGRAAVRTSDTVWFISRGVVADDIASGALIELPIDTRLTAGPVGIMERATGGLTTAGRVLRSVVLGLSPDYAASV